jgi:hypothetical protein
MNWRTNIQAALAARRDRTMKGVSLSAGQSETHLRDVLKRGVTPSIDAFASFAHALGKTVGQLYYGEDVPVIRVPVVGEVAGGEAFRPIDDHLPGAASDYVDIDFGDYDPVAIRVRGDSMRPVYRDGDRLVCSRLRGADLRDAAGRDCAVLTADGRGYLKILQAGSRRGLWRLRSYDPAYDDVEDVEIEWAAPVKIRLLGR